MVNDKNYSARLICSKRVKSYIIIDCTQKFLEDHPELEGSKITENQVLTQLVKNYLGLFFLENGKHK